MPEGFGGGDNPPAQLAPDFPLIGAGVGAEDVFDVEFAVDAVLVVEEVVEAAAATGDETLVTRLEALPLLTLLPSSVPSCVGAWVMRLRETGAACVGTDAVGFGLNFAVAGETRTTKVQVSVLGTEAVNIKYLDAKDSRDHASQ